MRRRIVVIILCLAIVGGGGALYLRGVSASFVLWRCREALRSGGFVEADVNTKLHIGPLKPSVTLHVKHMDGGYDVVATNDVAFYSLPAPGCVVYPKSKVAIQLEGGPEASRVFGQVVERWGGGRLRSWGSEARNLRLGAPRSAEGRACWVVEYPNPLGAPSAQDAGPQKLAFLPITVNWKSIAAEVKTARLYMERGSGVPVQVEFLDAQGESVIVNTIRNLRLDDMGRHYDDFTFRPPPDYKIIRRKVDPKDPWKAFLPPENTSPGSFLLNKLRERLERR